MTRHEVIETVSNKLGLNEEQKIKVVAKADYIVSGDNDEWYKSTQKKAINSKRGLYAQAMHEANWVLYVEPTVDKRNLKNLRLDKKIYEVNEAENNLDRNFSFFKVKQYTVIEFFQQYNKLFYEIPQTGGKPAGTQLFTTQNEEGNLIYNPAQGPNGESPTDGFWVIDGLDNKSWVPILNTHKEFINKSKDYIGDPIDPIDKEVEQLMEQLARINFEIENFPKTHPFFKEGDILEEDADPYTKYYIQGGLTRPIYNSEVFQSIKAIAGYRRSDPDSNMTIRIPKAGVEAIGSSPLGPITSMQDL